MDFDRYGYGPVAGFYDELANSYSRGQIGATKQLSLECVRPGDRVLFPGVGRGQDAMAAARIGADVTAVDVSTAMLDRLRDALERGELKARLIEADVSVAPWHDVYDVVVANYFLNLFDAVRARAMIEILGRSLRLGGRLVISDFASPTDGRVGRWISELYYRPVNWIAWSLGLCALHPILDYAELLDPRVFRIVSVRRLPVFSGPDPAYVSLVAERYAD